MTGTASTEQARPSSGGLIGRLPLLRRRRWMSEVQPEARNPLMWLPLSIGTRSELAIGRRFFLPHTKAPDGVQVTEHEVPDGQGAFVYEPSGERRSRGVLLWIHGGGMIMGTPEASHHTIGHIAAELGVLVVSARYRLAPENPFPAGLDDCMAVLRWVVANAERLGVDASRIVLGGESAGGGLAATLAQRALDEGVPLAFQLLVYPMLDDRTPLRADDAGRGRLVWTPRSNRWAWSVYLGHAPSQDESRPYASGARRKDLTGLPPTWIGVGDLDLFHDEDLAYAERLREAGVPVALHVAPGMPHGIDITRPEIGAQTRAFRESMLTALAGALGVTAS